MRYETLTNMTTKSEKQAADVLLYLTRCAEAVEKIVKPIGIGIKFQIIAADAKARKLALRAQEMHTAIKAELAKVDDAVERSSRKRRSK